MYSYKQFTHGNCQDLNSVVKRVYPHFALGYHLWTERKVRRTTWLFSFAFSLSTMPCPLPAILNNAYRACLQSQWVCVCVWPKHGGSQPDRVNIPQQSFHDSLSLSSGSCHTLAHAHTHTHTCNSPSLLAYHSICLHGGTPSQNERHV